MLASLFDNHAILTMSLLNPNSKKLSPKSKSSPNKKTIGLFEGILVDESEMSSVVSKTETTAVWIGNIEEN